MKEPGLDSRHRDKNGEIGKKHGNTLVGTLRKIYGPAFAAGQPGNAQLTAMRPASTWEMRIARGEPMRKWHQERRIQ